VEIVTDLDVGHLPVVATHVRGDVWEPLLKLGREVAARIAIGTV
jgi:hypothetical protein